MRVSPFEIDRIAAVALAEDGELDVTTAVTVPADLRGEGIVEFRGGGVFAGAAFAEAVARRCDCAVEWCVAEGQVVSAGATLAVLRGPLAAIFRAERPFLNLLQRACGIASATRAFADAVAGTPCRILHTRKTAPGLRALDVGAVLAGGGVRHRLDLAHEVMVKDNHWQALRRSGQTLGEALREARARGIASLQVEVESIEQLEEACAVGVTRVLMDNQSVETLREWVRLARRLAPAMEIEATGGITLDNVRAYADAGVDFVSVGALTHSVRAADLAVEIRV